MNPEVFGLQEVRPWALRYLRRSFPDYRVVSMGRDNGRSRGEHCSVFARADRFEVTTSTCRWFSATPSVAGSCDTDATQPRIATVVTLSDKFDGSPLLFVNLHLDSASADARARSLRQLSEVIRETATASVVVGDFNATRDETCIASLLEIGLHDAMDSIEPIGATSATHHGFTGARDGARIDYIFASAEFDVESARIVNDEPGPRFASDHWPIVAILRHA